VADDHIGLGCQRFLDEKAYVNPSTIGLRIVSMGPFEQLPARRSDLGSSALPLFHASAPELE
jgi:hypothetical protein